MMKRIFTASTIALLLFFTSCSDDDKATGEVTTNHLTVKVDGVQKSFSDVRGRWVDGGNYLEITATNNGDEWLTFVVMSNSTRVPAGQYSLDDASGFSILSIYSPNKNNPDLNFTAVSGTTTSEDAYTLHINTINNSAVNGSFNGRLIINEGETILGTVTLTDGQFSTTILPN